MSERPPANRIPFEDLEAAAPWSLPSLSGQSIQTAPRKPPPRPEPPPSPAELDSEPVVKPAPLTVEALAAISEAAAEEGRAAGYAEGLEQGRADGEREGRRQATAAMAPERAALAADRAALSALLAQLARPLEQELEAVEQQLLDLAVALAEELLGEAIDADRARLQRLVTRVLAQLPASTAPLELELNPADAALYTPPQGRACEVREDAELSRGSCRARRADSEIAFDARARLAQYRAAAAAPSEAVSDADEALAAAEAASHA